MLTVAILIGLGWGMLLVAMIFGLWSGFRGASALSRGAHAVAWGAAGVLVVGALLAWGSGLPALESLVGVIDREALEGPVLSLILMAALAIPLKLDVPEDALRSSALLYLPAWLLTSTVLIRMPISGSLPGSTDWVTPIRFSLAVCGGLAGRALGRSLHALVAGIDYVEWPSALAYGLTTLVFGSAALVDLWQRGRLWIGADSVLGGGIIGAWLAWSADWLMPRRYPGLRAVLAIVAALLSVGAAINPT